MFNHVTMFITKTPVSNEIMFFSQNSTIIKDHQTFACLPVTLLYFHMGAIALGVNENEFKLVVTFVFPMQFSSFFQGESLILSFP